MLLAAKFNDDMKRDKVKELIEVLFLFSCTVYQKLDYIVHIHTFDVCEIEIRDVCTWFSTRHAPLEVKGI